MYVNFATLATIVKEIEANLNVIKIAIEPEVVYRRLREIESLAHREARHIRYSASSLSNT